MSLQRSTTNVITSSNVSFQRIVAGAYDDETTGYRYMNAVFRVTNTSSSAFQNLTLYAYNEASTSLGQTAIKSMINFGGIPITDFSVAQSIQPVHGMKRNGTTLGINPDEADFQAFSADEAQAIEDLALPLAEVLPGDDVLEYGFVARNASGGRRIEVGESGTISLTVRLPKPTVPALTPWKFVMKFVVSDEPVTRVTRGILEDSVSVAARASALNAADVMLLGSDADVIPGRNNLRLSHVRLSSVPTYMSQVGAFTFSRGYGEIRATRDTDLASRAPVMVGGIAPVLFSISPDLNLNTGLSFDPSTGAISGTPNAVNAATLYTVTATDTAGKISLTATRIVVNDLPNLSGYSSINGLKGVAVAGQVPSLTGGSAPFVYSISPALPTGMSLNASTGAIAGTPSVSQASTSQTITLTDANGATATSSIVVSVRERLGLNYANAEGTIDSGFSLSPVVANAGGSVTYTLTPNTLPTGLSFDSSTGKISGTPSVLAAPSSYSVSATDSGTPSDTSSASFTLAIRSEPTLAYNPTHALTVSAPASLSPVMTGGATPLTFEDLSSIKLSFFGLNLNSAGIISGVPTQNASSQSFTVRVTDGSGKTAIANFNLSIAAAPVITGYSSVIVRLGNPLLLQTPTVTGGVGTGSSAYDIDCLPALGFQAGNTGSANFRTDTGTLQASSTSSPGEINCTVQFTDSNGAVANSSPFGIHVVQVTNLSIAGVTSLVVGSSSILTASVTGTPQAFITSSGVTWFAECVLNPAGSSCDASKNVADYVTVNSSTGEVKPKVGAGAKVRIRAASNADGGVSGLHDMTFTGIVTLPI